MRTEDSLKAVVGLRWPGRIENSTVLKCPWQSCLAYTCTVSALHVGLS